MRSQLLVAKPCRQPVGPNLGIPLGLKGCRTATKQCGARWSQGVGKPTSTDDVCGYLALARCWIPSLNTWGLCAWGNGEGTFHSTQLQAANRAQTSALGSHAKSPCAPVRLLVGWHEGLLTKECTPAQGAKGALLHEWTCRGSCEGAPTKLRELAHAEHQWGRSLLPCTWCAHRCLTNLGTSSSGGACERLWTAGKHGWPRGIK
mmetsp:Transcript_22652/g.49597  ORF Transcript_22652/g.49597 Transcript_22652/m.49597 type:complete len:204 (-) Transcript_22652:1972-2583(-)